MRRHFEIFLIRVSAYILMERNLHRSKHVSRRDNNDMWYMAEKLQSIASRMNNKYEGSTNE